MTAWDAITGAAAVLEGLPSVDHAHAGMVDVVYPAGDVTATVAIRSDAVAAQMDDGLTGQLTYQLGLVAAIEAVDSDPALAEQRIAGGIDDIQARRRTPEFTSLNDTVPRAMWGDVAKSAAIGDHATYVVMVTVDIDAAIPSPRPARAILGDGG